MPAAPLPRRPDALILDGAAELLGGPGCPVCRYAAEFSDRYQCWFALEGHSDSDALSRLAESLGACARHTRLMMSQPGAAVRMTAVYRDVLAAAKQRLAGRQAPIRGCAACEHDEDVSGRALDTVIEGLADAAAWRPGRGFDGLCIPHYAAAAAAAPARVTARLTGLAARTLTADPPSVGWMAGDASPDAETRAILRRALPGSTPAGPYACSACLAGLRAEHQFILQLVGLSLEEFPPDADLAVCSDHLADAVMAAGSAPTARLVLTWQFSCHRTAGPTPSGRWIRWPHRQRTIPPCSACRARSTAANNAVSTASGVLRAQPEGAEYQRIPLCVRHLLSLRATDSPAWQIIAADRISQVDALAADLALDFQRHAWDRRHDGPHPDGTAWRRVAAYLDGAVFCGSPPV